jgi:hypothetical protein
VTVTLTQWLGSRTPGQVASILATRPDAVAPPVPCQLGELAERLEIFSSVAEAVQRLPAPAVQVVEVLQLLGPGAGEPAGLAAWLGCEPGDPELAGALELLTGQALAWPDGDRWRMAEPLYSAFRHPLGLGPPAAALLARHPVEQLRPIARTLGVPSHGRKQELVARIATELSDPERVRALVATADARTRARLERLAVEGPPSDEGWYGYYEPDPALRWAAQRGLVLPDTWGVVQVPREVAMALRGRGWHAPFTPRLPVPGLVAVDPDSVDHEAAAAAGAAVEQVTALLEAAGADPVTLLKAGGVGVKVLRRLARALGTAEDATRLWLELAFEAELLAAVREDGVARLLPTHGYDRWAAAEPGERLAALLPAWVDLPAGPLLEPHPGDPAAKPPPALVREHEGRMAAAVRRRLVRLAAELPAGQGVDPGRRAGYPPPGLPEAVCWLAPLTLARQDADRLVAAAWREAELVGVVAHGALTSVGRSLVDGTRGSGPDRRSARPAAGRGTPSGPPPAVVAACRALLPGAVNEAIFQADLTALVPGTPTRELAELLDAAADRESGGGAVTWRFEPGSVRRAMDAGHDPDALRAALLSRAATGTLPQPLRYLIADVARRHGAVRVRDVACVLRAEDPALVAEIAGARALRPLGLSVISPSVLGSASPAADTLAALRAAGYAPVQESPDGTPRLERVERRRAAARRRPAPAGPAAAVDPVALATALLAVPPPAVPPPAVPPPAVPPPAVPPPAVPAPATPAQRRTAGRARHDPAPTVPEHAPPDRGPARSGRLSEQLAGLAGHLAPGELRLLAHAIEARHPVTIAYTSAQGTRTTRVIDDVELEGAHLIAWCQLRDDERMFAVGRIEAVAPAP